MQGRPCTPDARWFVLVASCLLVGACVPWASASAVVEPAGREVNVTNGAIAHRALAWLRDIGKVTGASVRPLFVGRGPAEGCRASHGAWSLPTGKTIA